MGGGCAERPAERPEVLAAVLAALAGVRTGQRVGGVGGAPAELAVLLRPLLAAGAAGPAARRGALDVLLAAPGAEPALLAVQVARLRPGGRLVAVAPDEAQARRLGAALGLTVRAAVALGAGVAWSAARP